MALLKFGSGSGKASSLYTRWRRLLVAGWSLAVFRLNPAHRESSRREEPRFDHPNAERTARPGNAPVATTVIVPGIAPDAQRHLACHARAVSSCTVGPSDTLCASTVPMHVIESYVDVIRRAKGKPTLAEIEPGMPQFEAHLEDFVLDVFRAMRAWDER